MFFPPIVVQAFLATMIIRLIVVLFTFFPFDHVYLRVDLSGNFKFIDKSMHETIKIP